VLEMTKIFLVHTAALQGSNGKQLFLRI